MAEIKSSPCTAEQIVDLIRASHPNGHNGYVVSRGEAIDLIEQYAAVVAGEACIMGMTEVHKRTMAAFDAAMSAPLASPPDTAVSP